MLISAILLFLGVPLWMVAGMIILIFWNRRRVSSQYSGAQKSDFSQKSDFFGHPPRFIEMIRRRVKKQPGIFPVKVRPEADPDAKWPRKGYAQWVHDVLILRTGMGLMQSTPYGISGVESAEQDADPDEVKGLGEHPVVIRARLDDGSILQVALSEIRPELAPERLMAEREQTIAK